MVNLFYYYVCRFKQSNDWACLTLVILAIIYAYISRTTGPHSENASLSLILKETDSHFYIHLVFIKISNKPIRDSKKQGRENNHY